MRKNLLAVVGLAIATGVAMVIMRIRELDRAATERALLQYDTPRNFIQHTDWDYEVEIAALPSFVPASFRAPTTSATRPVNDDEFVVPVATKIVLRDEEDRRVIVALRRAPTSTAKQEAARRVMAEVAEEMGITGTTEVGERRLGNGMGWQFSYEAARHRGTVTIGVWGERVVVVVCACPDEARFRVARRTFERTLETVRLK